MLGDFHVEQLIWGRNKIVETTVLLCLKIRMANNIQYLNTQNCAKEQLQIFWKVTKNLVISFEEKTVRKMNLVPSLTRDIRAV